MSNALVRDWMFPSCEAKPTLISVAFNVMSPSATRSKWVSADWWIYVAASPNINLVTPTPEASDKSKPESWTWVSVTSPSSPNATTAASARNRSLNCSEDVPRYAPSCAFGTIPVWTVTNPDISTVPLISIAVAAIWTSASATISNWPSVLELM